MASEKTTRPKRKASPAKAAEGGWLRLLTDPRYERKYESGAPPSAIVSTVGFSLGAVALGAGVYAQWFRGDNGPHPYALYLLIAGAAILLGVALFGNTGTRPIRVGDAGVGIEKEENDVERIAWCDVDRVLVAPDAITFTGAGVTIPISRASQAAAAAAALTAAQERIGVKLEGEAKTTKLTAAATDAPKIALDPPQIAGQSCKASGEAIAFEKDARLCGRCGELYHKAHIPKRCLTCEAML